MEATVWGMEDRDGGNKLGDGGRGVGWGRVCNINKMLINSLIVHPVLQTMFNHRLKKSIEQGWKVVGTSFVTHLEGRIFKKTPMFVRFGSFC